MPALAADTYLCSLSANKGRPTSDTARGLIGEHRKLACCTFERPLPWSRTPMTLHRSTEVGRPCFFWPRRFARGPTVLDGSGPAEPAFKGRMQKCVASTAGAGDSGAVLSDRLLPLRRKSRPGYGTGQSLCYVEKKAMMLLVAELWLLPALVLSQPDPCPGTILHINLQTPPRSLYPSCRPP